MKNNRSTTQREQHFAPDVKLISGTDLQGVITSILLKQVYVLLFNHCFNI